MTFYTKFEFDRLVYIHENKCWLCGRRTPHLFPVHIIPTDKGGTNLICNIAPICFGCDKIHKNNYYIWNRTRSMNKVISISLYANPLHSGHVNLIREAASIGSYLVAIINNDAQVILKDSTEFMNEQERLYVVGNVRNVDNVLLAQDKDQSVCETLKWLRPHVFVNGGDVGESACREKEICFRLGIEMVFGVGGEKTQSSSKLKKNNKLTKEECMNEIKLLRNLESTV